MLRRITAHEPLPEALFGLRATWSRRLSDHSPDRFAAAGMDE